MLVFGHKGLYSGKLLVFRQNGCIRATWLYSGKVVVFRQKWLYRGKVVVFGQKWFLVNGLNPGVSVVRVV